MKRITKIGAGAPNSTPVVPKAASAIGAEITPPG
jgi:hypothetical protein